MERGRDEEMGWMTCVKRRECTWDNGSEGWRGGGMKRWGG